MYCHWPTTFFCHESRSHIPMDISFLFWFERKYRWKRKFVISFIYLYILNGTDKRWKRIETVISFLDSWKFISFYFSINKKWVSFDNPQTARWIPRSHSVTWNWTKIHFLLVKFQKNEPKLGIRGEKKHRPIYNRFSVLQFKFY